MGTPDNRPVADFLPTINIKAKDFAAEMTNVNVQQKDLYGEGQITKEHVDNNKAVRQMMIGSFQLSQFKTILVQQEIQ
jgi:DNA-damage-inducible protein D